MLFGLLRHRNGASADRAAHVAKRLLEHRAVDVIANRKIELERAAGSLQAAGHVHCLRRVHRGPSFW